MTPPITSAAPAANPAGHALSAASAVSSVPAQPPHSSAPDVHAITVLPARYNAAADLLGRNLDAGRGARIAYIDDTERLSYAELDARCRRFAAALSRAGFRREERAAVRARHHRLSDSLSRLPAGRRGAGCCQHAADRRGLCVHART